MSSLLQIQNLVKHYKEVEAVRGVSFDIQRSSCFGLLGPNGAGKTTTVEMLEGITTPTSGEIIYQGQPLGDRFRYEAGIMFQTTALQDFITVSETLKLFQRFYDKTVPLEELVERCALQEFLNRDTRKLSGGQRQRLLLALALLNDPEILFLDEPTTGLDPQARRNFWELVHGIKSEGKSIILTTHYMEEAYELCDKIIIMDHGKIIAEGTPQQLLAQHFSDVVAVLPATELAGMALPMPVIKNGDNCEIITRNVDQTIQQLIEAGVSLTRLRIRERTLDDLFLQLTGKELRR